MSGPLILALRVIMTAALYSFLIWALFTLWRDLKRQNELLTARLAPSLTLVSQESGQKYHFTRSVIRIGRDLACDCCLEDKTISMQHARLSFHHSQWWLEDLGSTNGTFLNQEPVNAPVVVTQGDQIRLGQIILRIAIGRP